MWRLRVSVSLWPLQAWDGELPGTLPMVAGTGEAPSAVLPYHGHLWVTSWGDYRIERFRLQREGASFRAEREIVVQGDNHFRPVDFAVAPDGALFFTDWVERSYPVHGKGRIWRLRWKDTPPESEFPRLSELEQSLPQIAARVDWTALDSKDPMVHTAAVAGLIHQQFDDFADLQRFETARQRLGVLEAAHWRNLGGRDRSNLITAALGDTDPNVQLYAVRWIAEEMLTDFRAELEQLIRTNRSSLPLFNAVVAAIEWLDTGKTNNAVRADYLARVLKAPNEYDPSIVAGALRSIPSNHVSMTVEKMRDLVDGADDRIRRAAVRSLVLSDDPQRHAVLGAIAGDQTRDEQLRADAVAGLARDVERNLEQLRALRDSDAASVRSEAARGFTGAAARSAADMPSVSDTDAWLKLLQPGGDARRGWRRFFGSGSGRCANCHVYEGRGADIGPDLTDVAHRLDRRRLIESILQPSREVAPRYVVTILETDDGRVVTGLSLGADSNGQTERFVDIDGRQFAVELDKVVYRSLSPQTVMPANLHTVFSIDDLRDLLALFQEQGA